jgi:hypothetical protein
VRGAGGGRGEGGGTTVSGRQFIADNHVTETSGSSWHRPPEEHVYLAACFRKDRGFATTASGGSSIFDNLFPETLDSSRQRLPEELHTLMSHFSGDWGLPETGGFRRLGASGDLSFRTPRASGDSGAFAHDAANPLQITPVVCTL